MKLHDLYNEIIEHFSENKCFLDENLKYVLEQYNEDDWKQYVLIKENQYNRIKLFENKHFEVLLLVWDTKQEAHIHDHAENGCWLKLLKGKLKESIYSKSFDLLKMNEVNENNISFMTNDKGYHSIENINNDISVSLHIYSPPNHKTNFFF